MEILDEDSADVEPIMPCSPAQLDPHEGPAVAALERWISGTALHRGLTKTPLAMA